jgi:hypothetical protein
LLVSRSPGGGSWEAAGVGLECLEIGSGFGRRRAGIGPPDDDDGVGSGEALGLTAATAGGTGDVGGAVVAGVSAATMELADAFAARCA